MDQVKGFVSIIIGAIILFYVSQFADDLQYFIGKFHEELHSDYMAQNAYENVIEQYGNCIPDAKERLAAMGVQRYVKELADEKKYREWLQKYSNQPPKPKDDN
ncbi:MAG: hypothetical protein PHW04_02055 [Candidatus Wallbacteria bacterium]|nr:hypothetical protein [Candidatus Wallbacteria bacterium]